VNLGRPGDDLPPAEGPLPRRPVYLENSIRKFCRTQDQTHIATDTALDDLGVLNGSRRFKAL
jgi:hypothetical protein